jgi:hypothetical protein
MWFICEIVKQIQCGRNDKQPPMTSTESLLTS